MSDRYSSGAITVHERDGTLRARRLAAYMTAKGFTAAQYNAAKTAFAAGTATAAQIQMACAMMLDSMDVE